MKELGNTELVELLIEFDEDFDPINDKKGFEDLIRSVAAHCNIEMTNRCLDFDADMLGDMRCTLADRLVKYSDAYDHYGFADAYDNDMERARRDALDSLATAKSTKELLESLVEDYYEVHGDLPDDVQNDVSETLELIDDYIADTALEGGMSQCDIPEKIESEIEDSIDDGLDYTE